MAVYTMTIKELLESGVQIFDFDYMFYNHDLGAKEIFENKFLDQFYFYEIGFDDVDKFKHFLRTKLITSYPYYYQLYQTELRCADIDFMLNKDLKETIKRELKNTADNLKESTINGSTSSELSNSGNNTTSNELNSTENGNINANLKDVYSETNNNDVKESNIANGVSSIDLNNGYLTGRQNTTGDSTYNLEETNTANNSNTIETTQTTTNTIDQTNTGSTINEQTQRDSTVLNENQTETTELLSQGNIGVTSSAELLEKWRRVILNIDMMLLNELSNLFLKIY